ncbi:MAG: hypothetical protein HY851_05645, partial [candidate division Zixibacteria bacterium]|nr:hypothetical protein [candidate division Zixibacteria bacterium]
VIGQVMKQINADLFVLTEVAEDGALDDVVKILGKAKVGQYSCAYGKTGSQQRVAMMWDRDWVRTKKDPAELFADRDLTVIAEDGRKGDVFPRLPFWGYFEGIPDDPKSEGFTFELTGVHLKSQMPPRGFSGGRFGIKQRTEAATMLADWLTTPDQHYDEDILIVGDWNAAPGLEEWKPMRDLEKKGEARFEKINPGNEITHVARLNKSGPAGTRLDFHLISKAADAQAVPKEKGVVIQWKIFDQLSDLDGTLRKALYTQMRNMVSDHLAVVTRFYFTNAGPK